MKYLSDEKIRLALGHISRASTKHVAAQREDGNSSPQTVWGSTGEYPFQDVANTLTITSNNAADGSDLVIEGLDADYAEITETVTLNGTANVSTSASFLRVNGAFIQSGNTNVGQITIKNDSADDLQGVVVPGAAKLTQSVQTIPANHTGVVVSVLSTVNVNQDVDFEYFARTLNDDGNYSPFRLEHFAWTRGGVYKDNFAIPFVFPEKSDFDIRVKGSSSINGNISTTYNLVLIDNTPA